MIAAQAPNRQGGRLLTVGPQGDLLHLQRSDLAGRFEAGDVVIANDAATLPASLMGVHENTGSALEVRLAGWTSAFDSSRFIGLAFGFGDYRTPTERRNLPPPLSPGDRLTLGPLMAEVERLMNHPRLFVLRFLNSPEAVLAGLARHGRPIQYAHVPEALKLWDVWTAVAARPIAFEAPSAGFALDWHILDAWRRRGVQFGTLTHAAGISSTGDESLDARLPFDEPYDIPARTAEVVNDARTSGRRIVAIGTSVVRALEASAQLDGWVKPGRAIARNRIGPDWRLRIVDSLLTGMHQPGESHFELLRAFAGLAELEHISLAATERGYRAHEFGDFLLLNRQGDFIV